MELTTCGASRGVSTTKLRERRCEAAVEPIRPALQGEGSGLLRQVCVPTGSQSLVVDSALLKAVRSVFLTFFI